MPRPLVLIHGYSDRGESFGRWKAALGQRIPGLELHTCSYRSLVNEISLDDIAEGFDRALRLQTGLAEDEPFDAVVHSTGMLVLRAWLTTYPRRRDRLKHLIALAPATFGSPLAHKGRSWLGAIFKGNRELGPDFLEAGDQVLDGLELASRYTWDLAHRDLLGDEVFYGSDRATPYVFVLCGHRGYRGLRALINEDGTDGTVRWAGCALTTRKIIVDLRERLPAAPDDRVSLAPWTNLDSPLVPVAGVDHGSILLKPTEELSDAVAEALAVSTRTAFDAWHKRRRRAARAAAERMGSWQQFVVRAVDERGAPVNDYNVQLLYAQGKRVKPFDASVHVYAGDHSLRCFHVNLARLPAGATGAVRLRVVASSGTCYVTYRGIGADVTSRDGTDTPGRWDAEITLPTRIGDDGIKFFFPFTTTLLELRLDREPMPLTGPNQVSWFLP